VIAVREPHYHVDLPGEWEAEPGTEESSACFVRTDGPGRLTVTLLGVKPMFAIADQHRLLDDYMSHRATFEAGPVPQLEQSEPESEVVGDMSVGSWTAVGIDRERRLKHLVALTKGLLVDFMYEETGTPEGEFLARADEVLLTARVSAEPIGGQDSEAAVPELAGDAEDEAEEE
jgi:hypothetical protein